MSRKQIKTQIKQLRVKNKTFNRQHDARLIQLTLIMLGLLMAFLFLSGRVTVDLSSLTLPW